MYASINGTKIFFDIEGNGVELEDGGLKEKPVCFLLHGGPGGTHFNFKPHVKKLAEEVQLVYIDNRGSGFSAKGPQESYTLENNVEDIEALRQYLGLKEIYILGHSYGGMVAMSYARKYQQNLKGLILVTTSPSYRFMEKAQEFIEKNGTDDQKRVTQYLWDGSFESAEQVQEYYEVMSPLYSEKVKKEGVSGSGVSSVNRSFEALNEGFGNFLKRYDLTGCLSDISVPTLVIAGKHDWITPVDENELIAELIPDSKFVLFENSSHNVLADENEKFTSTVGSFIANTEKSTQAV